MTSPQRCGMSGDPGSQQADGGSNRHGRSTGDEPCTSVPHGSTTRCTPSRTTAPTLSTYALTQVVTITHRTIGLTSFDANLSVSVPEQASLMIVGLAFVLLGGLKFYWKGRVPGRHHA